MEELKIKLTFNPDHLREIYYRNGNGSVFTYHQTKKAMLLTILFILFTCIVYFISLRFSPLSWMIFLGLLAVVASGIYTVVLIVQYFKWKNSIETWLKRMGQYKTFQLHVTEHAIEMVADSKHEIDRWEAVQSVILEETYISLTIPQRPSYIFPLKSMKLEEYRKLEEIIRSKIK